MAAPYSPSVLTEETARLEVAWVARRARELLTSNPADCEWAEFFNRKAALLDFIGEAELAATARELAAVHLERAQRVEVDR